MINEPPDAAIAERPDGRFRRFRRENPAPTLDERQAERFRVFSLYVAKIAKADWTAADLVWVDPAAIPAFARQCRKAAKKLHAVAKALKPRRKRNAPKDT